MKQLSGIQSMAIAGALLLSACASNPQLSHQDVLRQYNAIAQLDANITNSRKMGADYLAPEGFQDVEEKLQQAISSAQNGNTPDVNKYSKQGLRELKAVDKNTASSRRIFVELLANRDRAIKAGAEKLFPDEFNKLESNFHNAANLVENNKLEAAKKLRPVLITDYGRLELKSVKKDAAQAAKAAIESAKEKDADDYAPKTFKLAEEELTLALSILEANRSQSDKAGAHTTRAVELANQSIQITEMVKDFDRRDYSEEDKVLWYQKQLSTINEPLKNRLIFDQDNRSTVHSIRNDISALKQSETDLRDNLKSTENRVEKLLSANRSELGKLKKKYEREISQQNKQREALEKRERDTRQRFEYVQSLFTEEEADVYRKRQNVLVLAHGFYFEPGKSEIKAVNFSLLNKIDQAYKKFPKSSLIISGHTDATGNPRKNKLLSEKRAANVAKFLQDTKGIKASKISVRGFGAEKPVASNSTKDGRSRNRRIEVLIQNSATI